ncbi:MAG: hypothetical protein R2854_25830 [Caldilineaceae bacterium]
MANLYAAAQTPWRTSGQTRQRDLRGPSPSRAWTGLEGFYRINVRGSMHWSSVTPAQRPARLARRDRHQAARPNTSFYSVDDSETSSATTYRCVAGDTNLVLDTTCKPQVANPPADFRNGDIVQTTYAEVDPWYASAITDTAAALRRGRHPHLLRQPDQRWPCEPCDRYAHCTVTAAQPAVEAAGAPAQAAWRRKPLLRLGLLVSLDRCPWRRRPRLMRPATSSSRSTTRRLR